MNKDKLKYSAGIDCNDCEMINVPLDVLTPREIGFYSKYKSPRNGRYHMYILDINVYLFIDCGKKSDVQNIIKTNGLNQYILGRG